MEFLEVPLFDDDVFKLLFRFAINVFFLVLVVVFGIKPSQTERNFAFTAVMMNVTVFFICFALKKLELELGMALGLFAIFGVLRYRTDSIRTKEMTYLFIVIGLAVINSLSNRATSYTELLVVNFTILGVAMLKEFLIRKQDETPMTAEERATEDRRSSVSVDYDKLELLAPDREADLLLDLRTRTGLRIERVQIKNIDLRKNSAELAVWMTPTK